MLDAQLLEAWRAAARDPDNQVYLWLRDGAPTGIKTPLLDPGIYPNCYKPADIEPQDLHCDEQQLRNYPRLRNRTSLMLSLLHIWQMGTWLPSTLMPNCRSLDCLEPIPNKLGLIVKTRNGITKARMILDTKQSGVKRITSQAQRVILQRLFDAILQILFLLNRVTSGSDSSV